MTALIPNRFLFHFEFPLRYRSKPPKLNGDAGDWGDEFLLPALGELDSRPEFAQVWACWNESGLNLACRVINKRRSLRCDPKSFWTGDNLRLCVDMRDAREIKRASKFCRQFFFLPTGGGANGKMPVAGVNRFQRAQEDAPRVDAARIRIASNVQTSGYTMEAHVPAECLSGFDPVDHARIGFYYMLEDTELGQQYLTIGDELSWYVDPSTWATAVLQR